MTYLQNNKLKPGLHYNVKQSYTYESFKAGEYFTNSNLNDFHTYSIEWDKFEINWFFDENKILTKNINRKLGSIYTRDGQPFDESFRLLINLGVGPFKKGFFTYSLSVLDDVMEWKCSLFIIDYVRIYEWVDRNENSSISSGDTSKDKICETVMPHIRPKKKANQSNSDNTILIVSNLGFVLLLV
jgi:beta-glucanase (GH16 family)